VASEEVDEEVGGEEVDEEGGSGEEVGDEEGCEESAVSRKRLAGGRRASATRGAVPPRGGHGEACEEVGEAAVRQRRRRRARASSSSASGPAGPVWRQPQPSSGPAAGLVVALSGVPVVGPVEVGAEEVVVGSPVVGGVS